MFKSQATGVKFVIQHFTNNQLLVNITDSDRFGTVINCQPMQVSEDVRDEWVDADDEP